MNWFARLALHNAAWRFGRRLPGELSADWGASDNYTPEQVRSALKRCRLGGRYVAIAYAAFLTQAEYLVIAPSLPLVLPYDRAREIYFRWRPDGDRFGAERDAELTSARVITRTLY